MRGTPPWLASGSTGTARLVLACLAWAADWRGVATVSVRELAAWAGVSRSTCDEHVRALVAAGEVEIVDAGSGRGARSYRLRCGEAPPRLVEITDDERAEIVRRGPGEVVPVSCASPCACACMDELAKDGVIAWDLAKGPDRTAYHHAGDITGGRALGAPWGALTPDAWEYGSDKHAETDDRGGAPELPRPAGEGEPAGGGTVPGSVPSESDAGRDHRNPAATGGGQEVPRPDGLRGAGNPERDGHPESAAIHMERRVPPAVQDDGRSRVGAAVDPVQAILTAAGVQPDPMRPLYWHRREHRRDLEKLLADAGIDLAEACRRLRANAVRGRQIRRLTELEGALHEW